MTILFDIDHTLFDTDKFLHQLALPALAKYLNTPIKQIEQLSQTYWSSLKDNTEFDPQTYLLILAKHQSTEFDKLKQIFYQPTWFKQSLFPEVLSVLSKLKLQHQLGIYSQGNITWQMDKLKLSGLYNLLEPELILIDPNKQSVSITAKIPQTAIIVDDKLDFLTNLQNRHDLKLIWLNRQNFEKNHQFTTINNLQELPNLLQSIS